MKIILCFLLFVLLLSAETPAQEYKRGVLIEDFTSQYCQFSPRGDHYIDSICKLMPDNVVALVWHNGFMQDDFSIRAGDSIASLFATSGVPEILSNRLTGGITPEFTRTNPFHISGIQKPAMEQPNVQIAITGETYDPISRKIECDLRIRAIDPGKLLFDTAQYYAAAVITEDSIISWQRITCEGMITDTDYFIHNNVVRAIGGKVMGDTLSLYSGNTIRLHYIFYLKQEWNPQNIKIKAFVGVKSPLKKIQHYTVLNAIQTSNASHFPLLAKPYAAILQPRSGDTLDPRVPISIVIDRRELKDTMPLRLFISADDGLTWDGIGDFDGISSISYNCPDSFKRKPLQLKITSFDYQNIYAVTGIFYVMGSGKKSIYSVSISGYPNKWVDSTYSIFWDYTGDVSDLASIEISEDQIIWKTLFSGIHINSGKEGIQWKVAESSMPQAYIRVISDDGIVGLSPQFSIVTPVALTVAENQSGQLLENFPNPFRSSTQIHYVLPFSEEVTLVIHDLLGKEVMRIRSKDYEQAGDHNVVLGCEGLQSGTYIITLITKDKKLQKKIIIQK